MTKILVATKDAQMSKLLSNTLTYNGFTVETALTEDMAQRLVAEINFSLVLVDFNFSPDHGVKFYNDLNVLIAKPAVIMMGDLSEERDLVGHMYRSMDDFILKPFGLSELKMIVNRQLERKSLLSRPIIYGDLKIDVARSVVFIKNNLVTLGKKEMQLLTILAKKAGKIVSPDQLVTRERIEGLRKKLHQASGEVFDIKSVRGLGYKLVQLG